MRALLAIFVIATLAYLAAGRWSNAAFMGAFALVTVTFLYIERLTGEAER